MKRSLSLIAVLTLLLTACGSAEHAPVDLGTGPRFVREVVDSVDDMGRFPAVVLTPDGTPVVAYFGFPEELAAGEVAAPRPIGSPSVPGVMLATVDEAGVWIRGAIVIKASIPNIDVAFNPAFDEEAVDMSAGEATGLALAMAEDGTLHAAWGTSKGLWVGTGSSDPASATQWSVERVYASPPQGIDVALDGSGAPIVSFVSGGEAFVASRGAIGWATTSLGAASACDRGGCSTSIVDLGGTSTVVFTGKGGELDVATQAGGAWTVGASLYQGTSVDAAVAPDGSGIISFYDAAGGVSVASVAAGVIGVPMAVAAVDAASASTAGADTAVSVDAAGEVTVSWFDAADGAVSVARGALDAGFAELDSGTPLPAASPSVASAADPAVAAVAWYDPVNGDLLLGRFGVLDGLAFAVLSPAASPKPAPTGGGMPPTDCVDAVDGAVTVVALGVAFTDGECIRVEAGAPFTISFDNQDPASAVGQHNIAIFPSANDLANPLFRGDLVSGPAVVDYAVPALDAGQYFYHCDVHPNMTGQVVAESSGGAGGGGSGGGGGSSATSRVAAMGIAFDVSEIVLVAGAETTLTFDNQDAQVQHNIAIFASSADLANPLFRGDLITGLSTIDYLIPALEAGTYYFHCDVHPNMNGTVTVA